MKKMTHLAVKKPGIVFLLLAIITSISIFGITRLKMDSSTESLLPRSSRAYKMLQHTKRVFGDSKTFHITAVEAIKGKKLFTTQLFKRLEPIVTLIKEFQIFDKTREENRLQALLSITKIAIKSQEKQKKI